MEEQDSQQPQQPESAPTPTPPAKQPTRVTKPKSGTKIKNPKRVEQGKRLAAHNKMMKEQLSEGLLDPVQKESKDQNIPDWMMKYGGIAVGVGLGLFLLYRWRKPSVRSDLIEMEPVQVPVQQPVLMPVQVPEPPPEITMD